MSSTLVSEPNFQRKSHRVEFPLFVEVDGVSYRAKDWSLSGVGLKNFKAGVKKGEQVKARIILPMVGAVLSFDALLKLTALREEVAGFEFVDLPPRHRRILRHYIELAVEGRVDNLEDLVSVAATPGIHSPLEDALNLTELEAEGLLKNFKKNSRIAIGLGLLFVVVFCGVLFYNTVYRVQAVGFVAGNLVRVTANQDGAIHAEVTENSFVEKGTALFTVENRQVPQRLGRLEARLAALSRLSDEPGPASGQAEREGMMLLSSLREEFEAREREYANAEHLYNQRILSSKELALARNAFQQARSNWLREQERQARLISSAQARQPREVGALLAERDELARAGRTLSVAAPCRGRVHSIAKAQGEYALANEPVLVMECDRKPYVLIRLLTSDALKLSIGMPVEVYVPFEDRRLAAEVSAIGHAAVNATMTESMEGSLNETLVKIDFRDATVRLPANSRVKVWIRTW